ncbi:hypothetical protein ASE04_19070 [Rhizobium sp. Root708]|uniref:sigma-70 family RNA polymerase sigma factor n=1 Tax=Rhizobium sp. Root708 TaxID=1736592 RepID=UPI0006FFE962|nr:sigma-70 family RNA polymerase sigma factor [Rhizobium sp. Root708]KRB49271.1 hypothetical protein ASE04_19070 [Rhizobium sp. Root708]
MEPELVTLLPTLRAFALRLTRTSCDADDLVQEMLVKALANKERFAPGTNLKSWTFTIMRNTFLTSSRMSKRSPLGAAEDAALLELAVLASQDLSLHCRDVEKAIAQLLPLYRETLLHVASGMSCEETAHRERCEVGTVKSRVGRARAHLLSSLGARTYGEAVTI